MNKSKLIWIVGGIGTAVGVYFLYKRITQPIETFGEGNDVNTNTNNSKPKTTTNNDGLPLKRGSKGEKVKQLQRFLVSEGYNIGSFGILSDGVDGDFGRMTENAVTKNQQPFSTFKSMYPTAVEGQVSAEFFNTNIKGKF